MSHIQYVLVLKDGKYWPYSTTLAKTLTTGEIVEKEGRFDNMHAAVARAAQLNDGKAAKE